MEHLLFKKNCMEMEFLDLQYTLNVDEENKVGGKLTVWFRSLLSLLGEPT